MATIERRVARDGTTVYRARVRLQGVPSRSATFDLKRDASRWAADVEEALRRTRAARRQSGHRATFAEALARYEEENKDSRRSWKDQWRHLQWWRRRLGGTALDAITPALIRKHLGEIAGGPTHLGTRRSDATVNRYLSALSSVLTAAVKQWRWLEDSPVSAVRRGREAEPRVRILTRTQRQALLAACRDSEHAELYPAVVMSLSTGARLGELLSLEWRDVDFQRNVLRLGRTASQFGRTVPLVGHPLRVMRSYYRAHGRESHLVFPSSGGGRSPARLRQAWNTAIGHSGIADFGFKDLRHCAAAYLAENGGTLTDIAELLGHNTLHAVQRYAHLVVPRTAHAVTKVSTGIFEQLPRRA